MAGGFGTRLSHIVPDKPKRLAPIGNLNTPFLEFVVITLKKQGFDNFVFLTGYKAEQIEELLKPGGEFRRFRFTNLGAESWVIK